MGELGCFSDLRVISNSDLKKLQCSLSKQDIEHDVFSVNINKAMATKLDIEIPNFVFVQSKLKGVNIECLVFAINTSVLNKEVDLTYLLYLKGGARIDGNYITQKIPYQPMAENEVLLFAIQKSEFANSITYRLSEDTSKKSIGFRINVFYG
jgi:hypothetical protein